MENMVIFFLNIKIIFHKTFYFFILWYFVSILLCIYKVDAFVAMGGNADRSGYVSKETIINIIKNEFELSYNMEAFLDGFGE